MEITLTQWMVAAGILVGGPLGAQFIGLRRRLLRLRQDLGEVLTARGAEARGHTGLLGTRLEFPVAEQTARITVSSVLGLAPRILIELDGPGLARAPRLRLVADLDLPEDCPIGARDLLLWHDGLQPIGGDLGQKELASEELDDEALDDESFTDDGDPGAACRCGFLRIDPTVTDEMDMQSWRLWGMAADHRVSEWLKDDDLFRRLQSIWHLAGGKRLALESEPGRLRLEVRRLVSGGRWTEELVAAGLALSHRLCELSRGAPIAPIPCHECPSPSEKRAEAQ